MWIGVIYLGFKILSNISVIFCNPFISNKIKEGVVLAASSVEKAAPGRVVMMEQRQLEEKDEVKLQSSESSEAELEERERVSR